MTGHQIEERLRKLGNGAAISYWNAIFDINLLPSGLMGECRIILAAGKTINEDLFDRADSRLKQLTGGRYNDDLASV